MRFWDASAVVPLLVDHTTTPAVFALQREDPEAAVWWGTRVECVSAIVRRVRTGELPKSREAQALTDLRDFVETAVEVEPTDDVRDRAVRLLETHPLRAADALQLAAALVWARERTAGVGFVCLDDRLRQAAAREGYAVLPA